MNNRRLFLAGSLAGLSALCLPLAVRAAPAKPKVVILGGGAGGATAALTLRRFAGDRVEITLIEQDPVYVTCFFSNWVIADLRKMEDITHRYDRLRDTGITVVTARAASIDRDAKAVVLEDGSRLAYDRMILSPGIDLDYAGIPGYSAEAAETMPHGWKAGPQTVLLRDRLHALEDGARIVMTVPDAPYRCPPGPYERASVMAHVLKAKGLAKARISILDNKEKFSKQALFQEGWERHYPGMIEWLPPSVHGGITGIDPSTQTVTTALSDFAGDLVNIIPPNRAGRIALEAGLGGDGVWCPVAAESMVSAIDPAVQVIGDAANAGEMPKSAFAANSQAKLAALVLLSELIGRNKPEPRYFNTCWSLIAPDDGVKVGGSYWAKDGAIKAKDSFVSQPGESADERRQSVAEAEAWYQAAIGDIFGI